ncbi:serine--tRNA ligase [Saccharicrinis aurantiacus]|uniref:serine--tRNA ligase n=1 Tax=Saccharicrinis aurantiacus TaxID=1849719 RepID=UPI00095032FF|nr:serine--tRNA ligase [Saccharicrinis aurantiacus]
MLTLKFIQENKETVIERLKVKRFDAAAVVENIIELDNNRKSTQSEVDQQQSEMNSLSKEIGMLFKQGKAEEANVAKSKTAELKENIKSLNTKLNEINTQLDAELVKLPNIPHPTVPEGNSDEDNQVEKTCDANIPELGEGKLPHWELIKKYDIIDFELGTKIAGAGFPVYKGKGARLQRALINFFLDEGQKAGYNEVLPPILVNEASGFGTGQLPDKEGMMYHATADNLYLIPTAEVPVTNIYRDEVVKEEDLPLKTMAYTPCFRREAGSWGAHVRGLNRLHQFDKVEIVQISHPDKSYEALDGMVAHVENLVNKLGLPYRLLRLCGGDISFTSALTFDFEVFSAAQERWLEVSSVSNFENYQANRLKCRYKGKDMKKPELAHTLNGSALAVPRILAAILENNQTADGIKIPEVLVPYTGFDMIN